MDANNLDPEKGHAATSHSQEEALYTFGRKSDAMDADGRAYNSSPVLTGRKSSSSCLSGNFPNGSPRKRSETWYREDNEEIHISRTSSFDTQRLSFSIGGPVQVPEGNLGKLVNDVEAGRNEVEGDFRIYIDDSDKEGKRNQPSPIFLKFVDVKYKVVLSQTASWKSLWGIEKAPSVEKEILHGISGSVSPGEFLAMMGPSGSGKTTLLSLLGGRNHQHMTGEVTYNELPFHKSLKRRIGFVTQDDVLYPHLTVSETLMYAALLMLPKDLTKQQKIERVEQVIQDLRLERCRDTMVGSHFLRGVSGGERKRVCIGHELLMDPPLILLDEPTSGLDSTTALRTIQILKSIALKGRTVVTTIHQPSSRVFHVFDKLILLSEGHLLYFGKASSSIDYFSCLGFNSQIAMNPADFLLDLCSGNMEDISMPPTLKQKTVKTKDIRQYMIDAYKSRLGKVEVTSPPRMLAENFEQSEDKREWRTTWWQQFSVLMIRGLKERRHEYLSWLRFIQVSSISVMAGCLWWQSKIDTERDLIDQGGLLFFISMFWGYFPLFTAIFTFPQERALLIKERGSDMYRLSSYFFARTLGDLPLDLILTAIFMVIVYFMAHLRMSIAIFCLTLLANFLNVITSQGLGLAIGAAMMDVKKATTLASVLVLAFMIAGGYFVQHIPGFIKWLRYCSFQYYTFKLLMKVQYNDDQVYDCGTSSGCKPFSSSPAFHGVKLGGGGEEVWAMLIMALGYRVLAYIALRRQKLN
ncbi:ABC transporter G family member 22 [Cryptomeria japonica]|uniref:ABC transporter G family member 22 n=1 Tax=Cryptomeria japonica TaxID=3369 RepID=UPI0027DA6A9D|nr:ABC transporter G family member 22 [Cryptomeria japonica]